MKTIELNRLKKAANKDEFITALVDILTEVVTVIDSLEEDFDKCITDLENYHRTESQERQAQNSWFDKL